MTQSGFIAAMLLAGFVLFLAANNRLKTYTAVLWGQPSTGSSSSTASNTSSNTSSQPQVQTSSTSSTPQISLAPGIAIPSPAGIVTTGVGLLGSAMDVTNALDILA